MGKAYSKETRDAVVKARMSGMLVKDICRKFHVCDQTIRDWMKVDANVVGRTSLKKPPIKVSPHVQSSRENGRFSDEDRREVVKLYQEGYSVADICKSVQIGRSTLYRWISLHTEFRRYGGSEDELAATVADYINFFNTMRPHRKLAGQSPEDFEKRFYAGQQSAV